MATGDKKPVVMAADRGVANGVATLGADAKLNDSQIPMQKIMAVTNAAEYSQTQTYVLGAYCTRGGKLYRCTTAISAAEVWTDAHWTETTVGAELLAVIVALAAKAPAGYGLGGGYQRISDANSITIDGKYATGDSTLNLPVNGMFGVLEVSVYRSDKSITQLFRPGTDGWQPYSFERHCINGIWTEWGLVNPPMGLGVEYRTTERYLGKPVYVKLVDCGAGPNNTEKRIEHGASNAIIIDFGGYMYYSGGMLSIPWIDKSTLSVSNTKIVIVTKANYSGYNAYVWVKYYKTTD